MFRELEEIGSGIEGYLRNIELRKKRAGAKQSRY
jgi:hypothetical protein